MRNADLTRQKLLQSALLEFSQAPFDRVGLREVAAGANVDVALVRRYFGSKEGLFVAAIQSRDDLEQIFAGDLSETADHLARLALGKAESTRAQPLLCLIQSAGSEPAATILRGFISDAVTSRMAGKVDAADATQRAALVLALVTGTALFHGVMALPELDDSPVAQALLKDSILYLLSAPAS